MTDADPADAEEAHARDMLVNAMADLGSRDLLPVPELLLEDRDEPLDTPLPPVRPHVTVVPLDDGGWSELHRRLAFGARTNLSPWRRCLHVLSCHGAKTAVIEEHYVCLDYRSEFASFYAHLDAPRVTYTVRVHFFAVPVDEADVCRLDDRQQESYLGYVVCRSGDLPLVGRCLLRVPDEVQEHTAVQEPVHFFGQTLHVTGVPFMQQDERFAVCAHIAVWAAHYSAYRRGLAERRLVADFVAVGSGTEPLRPRIPDGLPLPQVVRLFDAVGFRTITYATPVSGRTDVPLLPFGSLPELDALHDRVSGLLPPGAPVRTDCLSHFAWDLLVHLRQTKDADPALLSPAIALVDAVLDHLVAPYIRSGWAPYAATSDHALLLCGRTPNEDGVVHYVHDDQVGPYLATTTLTNMSRDALRAQVPRPEVPPTCAPLTPAALTDMRTGRYTDTQRAVQALLVPCPPRALLPAAAAGAAAEQLRQELETTPGRRPPTVTLMMGIEYKRDRRDQGVAAEDEATRVVFSAVQLAEWVLVVEGRHDDEDVVQWELVYDASSGSAQPRLQLGRFGRSVVAVYPRDKDLPEGERLALAVFAPVRVPARSAKTGS